MRRETLIQPQHLERLALVYVRQSTPGQGLQNQESTRLQYGLRERAEQLGWARDRIRTIDEDLGVSGSGQEERRGFARLVLEVAHARAAVAPQVTIRADPERRWRAARSSLSAHRLRS